MGREQDRAWKHIHVCVASLILFSLLGCATFEKATERIQTKVAVASKETQESGRVNHPPKGMKEEDELREQLTRSKKLLAKGDYEGFLRENQKVLSLSGNRPPGDEALLNLGFAFVHPGNPKKDYGKSLGFFTKLVKDYSQSPLAEQAKIWIEILQENERLGQMNEKLTQTNQKLNEMIEKSKQIDIEIEERKREKLK